MSGHHRLPLARLCRAFAAQLPLAAFAVALVLPCLLRSATAADEPPVVHTLGKAFACTDYGGNKVCLVDAAGQITWQMPAQRPIDVWVLANGNVLFTHVHGAKEVTRDKRVVWQYTTAAGNEVHACQPLPDGLVMIAESGPMRIIEVDRQGKIVAQVKLTTEVKKVHTQMRGARKLADGHYLVGQYGDGVVREYDGQGKVVWEYRQKMAFGGIRLPDGNTLVATGDEHRIVEVDPQGKVVWEIQETDLPGNPLRFVAGMQRLPNGNTLVCNWGGHGHVGQQPQIFEVTRDGKLVGQLYDFQQFGTISGIYLMGSDADPVRFEVLR